MDKFVAVYCDSPRNKELMTTDRKIILIPVGATAHIEKYAIKLIGDIVSTMLNESQ